MTVVTIPYDILWRPLDWAKTYCPSYITNRVFVDEDGHNDITKISYYFGSEEDATMFLLKWK